jgi:hypothetical protein
MRPGGLQAPDARRGLYGHYAQGVRWTMNTFRLASGFVGCALLASSALLSGCSSTPEESVGSNASHLELPAGTCEHWYVEKDGKSSGRGWCPGQVECSVSVDGYVSDSCSCIYACDTPFLDGPNDARPTPYPALMREILAATKEDIVALGLGGGDVAIASHSIHPTAFGGPLTPQSIGSDIVDLAKNTFSGLEPCSVLRPLRPLEHAFFFGGVVYNGGGVVGGVRGIEGVVDVYDQEAAVFDYGGNSLSPSLGVSAGPYTGVAAAVRGGTGLVNLWSGQSFAVSGSVGFEKFLSVNASAFSSADGSIVGGSMGLAIGVGKTLAGLANVSVQGTFATFNGLATKTVFGGDGDGVARFSTARGVTQALLKVSPGISLKVQEIQLGREALTGLLVQTILTAKARKISLSQLCPG